MAKFTKQEKIHIELAWSALSSFCETYDHIAGPFLKDIEKAARADGLKLKLERQGAILKNVYAAAKSQPQRLYGLLRFAQLSMILGEELSRFFDPKTLGELRRGEVSWPGEVGVGLTIKRFRAATKAMEAYRDRQFKELTLKDFKL